MVNRNTPDANILKGFQDFSTPNSDAKSGDSSAFAVNSTAEDAPSEDKIQDVVAAAEELLSRRYGGMQSLGDIQVLNGSGVSLVLRARVANSPFLQQRSVVIKHTPAQGFDLDEAAMLREVIAYQFTTSLPEDVRPGPVLLAHDVDAHLLVITDSGDGDTFADLLETNNAQLRMDILRNLGEAIGKMHVGTAMKEPQFEILMHRMLGKRPELQRMIRFRERLLRLSIDLGLALIAQAGLEIPETVQHFANDAARRLVQGQHRAFTPFDLSPDNIIVANTTHFLDYEWAGFRDATFDLACVIAGFPQYLSSRPITDDEADIFIEAWVNEVSQMWPNVRNTDRLHARIITALIGWACSSVAMMHISSDTQLSDQLYELLDQTEKNIDVQDVLQFINPDLGILNLPEQAQLSNEVLGMIRRDLYETFEALERFATRDSDPRFSSVAQFAKSVSQRLRDFR